MHFTIRVFVALLFSLLVSLTALAQSTEPEQAGKTPENSGAPLIIFNRTVFTFHGDFLGATPTTRMRRAHLLIDETIRRGGNLEVGIKANPEGQFITLGGVLVFVVTTADTPPLTEQGTEKLALQAALNLEKVIAETREARSLESLLTAFATSGAATLIFALLLLGLNKLCRWLGKTLLDIAERNAEILRIGTTRIVEEKHLLAAMRGLINLLRWLTITILSYEWVSFVLSRFPYTRAWGERLNDYLLNVAEKLFGGIVGAIPGLGVAIAIFFIARFSTRFLAKVLERMAAADTPPSWLAHDTMPTTRRLFNIASGYLPSPWHTPTFRGRKQRLSAVFPFCSASWFLSVRQALSDKVPPD